MKLLFGGCMIKSLESKDLGFTGDADLKEWPRSVEKVKNKYKNARFVIPHHSMWGNMSLIDHTLKLCKK
jgi:metallo-beta-lactamase class B